MSRLPKVHFLRRRAAPSDPEAPVSWADFQGYTRRVTVAFCLVFLASAGALFLAQHNSHTSDREIFQSRIAAVHASCTKFNDSQAVLSLLVKVSLDADRRPDSSLTKEQRAAKQTFKVSLRRLAPNDCKRQREILTKALKAGRYDESVPYLHRYPPSRYPLEAK